MPGLCLAPAANRYIDNQAIQRRKTHRTFFQNRRTQRANILIRKYFLTFVGAVKQRIGIGPLQLTVLAAGLLATSNFPCGRAAMPVIVWGLGPMFDTGNAVNNSEMAFIE